MKKQFICLMLAVMLTGAGTVGINAEEIQPYATNIAYLSTSLTTSGTCLLGSVTGSFTGSGMHAIYYSEFQYLTSYGELVPSEFIAYYCNPIPGVKYRFHTNMKVYDSNDVIRDSDVINSNTLVY